MINRIAKVMWDDNRRILGGRLPEWEDIPTANQNMLRLRAKAVLQAMRDPTEAMVDAATHEMPLEVDDAWRVMIDEAMR